MCAVTNPRPTAGITEDDDGWEALRTHDAAEIEALELATADEADDAEGQSSA